MSEKLPENYEQSLEKFTSSQAQYQVLIEKLREIEKEARSHCLKLELNLKKLAKLRHNQAFKILAKKGLGICSAEIVPDELREKHVDLTKATEQEKIKHVGRHLSEPERWPQSRRLWKLIFYPTFTFQFFDPNLSLV